MRTGGTNGSKQQCLVLVRVTGPLYKSTVKIIFAVSTLFPGEVARPLPSSPLTRPSQQDFLPHYEISKGREVIHFAVQLLFFENLFFLRIDPQQWNGIS